MGKAIRFFLRINANVRCQLYIAESFVVTTTPNSCTINSMMPKKKKLLQTVEQCFSRKRIFKLNSRTLTVVMWIIAVTFLIMLPLLWHGSKSHKLRRKLELFIISVNAVFNFIFRMKSEDRLEAFREIHSNFPRFIHINFFKFRVLMVYDPEVAKRIFNSTSTMQRPYRGFVDLPKGLLFSSYADWREPRKHLNLAFNLSVLKGFIPIFSSYTHLAIQEMESHVGGDVFNLLPFIAQLTLRTVSATLLNVHRIELSSFEKLYDSINAIGECLFIRMSNPLLHPDFIYKLTPTYQREKDALGFLMQYGNELIDEARRRHRKSLFLSVDEQENLSRDPNELNRPKIHFIVDQLINHEEKFSDKEIRDHLLTLQITASDTTTNLVLAAVLFMAMNQDVQQRVYEEIVDVFHDDIVDVDYERLNELKYMESVLKETLRLFSPLPIIMREAFDYVGDVGTGKPLKKNTKIYMLLYILHQRKDIWGENPWKFDPENFSLENTSERDPYSFLPFGSGLRNCIGNRYTIIASKVFIMELLKAYKFTTKLQQKDMKMKLAFTGKLASEYSVSITKRK